MPDEKSSGKYGFWLLVLSSVIGTTAGYLISHYVVERGKKPDGYIDRAIRFLEDVRSKSQRGYDSE